MTHILDIFRYLRQKKNAMEYNHFLVQITGDTA